MMLMIMLQIVNHVNTKQETARKTIEIPSQPGNPGDANRPAQPAVLTLNLQVTIPLKYFRNF